MIETRKVLAACALGAVAMWSGCSKQSDSGAATPASGGPAQPMASHASATAAGGGPTADGTVLETMDASNYTYVRVKTASSEFWAASSTFKVAVGDRVVVPTDNPMKDFHSATLNRDFPLIYFAPAIVHAGEAMPSTTAQPATSPEATVVTEKIAPPAGGTSIADLWANRKSLNGKSVTVRGKVVKFNGGIMGQNWVHIQDGSGSAKDGTNDLTITSPTDGANVGDTVTVTGTVAIDQDFTAGYTYAVMLKNGKFSK